MMPLTCFVDLRFKDYLLHPEFGLIVFIFEKKGSRFIILKNQTFDLSKFLIELETLESKEEEKKRKNKLSQQFLHQAINALDTEYDKMTLKAILCFFLSTKECCELGIVTEKA